MENFTNISIRIKQIIEYKQLTINKFAEKVGASNSYFNKIIKNNTSIGSDKIENILTAFPEISAEWLIMGTGQMIKNNRQNSITKINDSFDQSSYNNLLKENELLKERISIQQQTIEMYKDMIELLELKNDKKKVTEDFFNKN